MTKQSSRRLFQALGAVLAGVTLMSAGGLIREGVRVQEYTAKSEKGYCTVLVYMDGSDLESDYGAATEDLREMEDALRTADVSGGEIHLVVEAGGARIWDYPAMKGKQYGRFCVTADGASDVEEMEARDMGEADTLMDFINYGMQSYPAAHYGLVLWNHGAGPINGFGCDSQFNDSSLSLHEIGEAVRQSASKDRFSFVSLDACLMGNIELAAVLDNKADYLIASEELEPQQGYDYSWIGEIKKEWENPTGDMGRRVGEAMLRSYESYYKENDYKLTLSLIDLQAYEAFHTCFHSVIEKLFQSADAAFYQQLGKQRKAVQGFGNSGNDVVEMVDFMDFMENALHLSGQDSDYGLLEEQYQKLVIDTFTKGYGKEPSGLSIYLPSGANAWILQDMSVYERNAFCDTYQSFLKGYQVYLSTESHIEWHSLIKRNQERIARIGADTVDDITSAYLMTFCADDKEGITYLLSTDSDVAVSRAGYLKAVPEETCWGLQNQVLCLIETVDTEAYTEYLAPVRYRNELCLMHICFSEEQKDGEITVITPADANKQEYELQDGDILYPLYPIRDMEEGSSAENVYQDSYYIGNEIRIDSREAGDGDLMLVDVKQKDCRYGFLLQDTRQRLYACDQLVS